MKKILPTDFLVGPITMDDLVAVQTFNSTIFLL